MVYKIAWRNPTRTSNKWGKCHLALDLNRTLCGRRIPNTIGDVMRIGPRTKADMCINCGMALGFTANQFGIDTSG